MKMQLKRIVSAVCAVALCASVVSTPVLANDNTDAGNAVPSTIQMAETTPSTTEPTPVPTEQVTDPTPAPTEQVTDPTPVPTAQTNGDPTEEPAGPAGDANTPSVMKSYSENNSEAVKVKEKIILGTAAYYIHDSWSVDQGDKAETTYISLTDNQDGTATVKGVKATGNNPGTVKVTHSYWSLWGWEKDVFYVKVLPSEPSLIYFFVALPSNTSLSMDGAQYRYLTCGALASENASVDMTSETNNAVVSATESVITGMATEWPNSFTLSEDKDAQAKFGSQSVKSGTISLDSTDHSVTEFTLTFDDGTGVDKTYTDDDYHLRWTKFSYANTSSVGWQYHMDAVLYKIVRVNDVLQALQPEKAVDGPALNEKGEKKASDFTFTLSGNGITADLKASVGADATTAKIQAATEDDGNVELIPGTYTISENAEGVEKGVWKAPTDTITFTVATDGTITKTSDDVRIQNELQKYSITYAAGADDVTNMPVDTAANYQYNEKTTVSETIPALNNKDFLGWKTDDGQYFQPGESVVMKGDLKLTADWADPDPGTAGVAGDVQIDKTATNVENFKSDVTLSIGADQKTVAADVVFVLDKSTSTDVKQAALNMLEELQKHVSENGLQVKVGLVTFNQSADNSNFNMELSELNDATVTELKRIFNSSLSSGTNIEAGIRKGMKMLDDDTSVPASNKHLVLVTDGVTYMWGEDSTKTMYVQFAGADNGNYIWNSNSIAAGVTDKGRFNITGQEYVDSFNDPVTWMNTNGASIEAIAAEYETAPVPEGTTPAKYVSNENSNRYIANDVAIYMAGRAWKEAKEKGYNLYAYASDRYNKPGKNLNTEGYYPWASYFIGNLSKIGGSSKTFCENSVDVTGMFDDVLNTIEYTIDHGTVTDVIGSDFDLDSLGSFKLTVGAQNYTGTVSGNTVTFDSGNYVVTYSPATTETKEQFTWEIKKPVESTASLALTYTVKLTTFPTEADRYTYPTNESATLQYTSSNGATGEKDFPVPEVDYDVVGIIPADLTIYMGGSDGYDRFVDANGDLTDSTSLPEPGFYLDIPDDMDAEIRQALAQKEGSAVTSTVVDLSDYVTLTATVDGQDYKWKLERYGTGTKDNESVGFIEDGNGKSEGRFIYKIVPDGDNGAKIRIKVTKDNQQATGSDEFEISDSLFDTYQMEIAGEGIDPEDLKMTFNITGKDVNQQNKEFYNHTTGVAGTESATLTVRYVVGEQDQVVTKALTDITVEHDSDKAYVVLKDLKGNEAKDFAINESDKIGETAYEVKADPNSVSLLFDDIAGTENTDFEKMLVDSAAKDVGKTFSDMKSEAKYLDLVDANNGNAWLTTNQNVTVYWPYPEGTDENTKFYLVHFKDLDREIALDEVESGIESAETELMTVETDQYGISFQTDSFSPYVLLWDGAKNQPTPSTDDGDDNDTTTTNNNTTTTTVNVTNNAAPAQPQAAAVIPQTGDEMPVGLLGGVAAAAAAAFVALFVIRKRKKD